MGDTTFRRTGRRTARGPFRAEARDIRREEGTIRNAHWAGLSLEQKRAVIAGRPGRCLKQRTQLGMEVEG